MVINSNTSTRATVRPINKPTAKDDFILVAIDGTWSRKDYNINGNRSYTLQFYDGMMVPPNQKYFTNGPDSALGLDSGSIEKAAWAWLKEAIKLKPNAKIVLVGHSRGGRGVTILAHELKAIKKDVWFLGLFDAVDRAMDFDFRSGTVPSNVKNMFHALRSGNLGSRTSFGNTATEFESTTGNYNSQEFIATHGSVGGSPAHAITSSWKKSFKYEDWCNRELSAEQNSRGGMKAWLYVLGGAKSVGVPVN